MSYVPTPEDTGMPPRQYGTCLPLVSRPFVFSVCGPQCLAENRASVRVLERLGMRQEGCQRPQQTWMQHRRWDYIVYAIDRAEWQEQMETKG
jgi:hypothetical protein